jgi:hypothetical protein
MIITSDRGVQFTSALWPATTKLLGSLVTAAELLGQHLRSAVPCVATRPPPDSQSFAALPKLLLEAEFVYVQSPPAAPVLSATYRGPYKVVGTSDQYFMLKIGDRFDAISIDRLKPHLGSSELAAAEAQLP